MRNDVIRTEFFLGGGKALLQHGLLYRCGKGGKKCYQQSNYDAIAAF